MSSAKWKLERFYDRLEEWARSVDPPPDAYAAVKNWIDSRQDAPHGDAWPLPADDRDAAFGVLLVDSYRRRIACH